MLLTETPRHRRTTRRRDRLYRLTTRLLSVALLPFAVALAPHRPHRARQTACQWALAARFPAESLDGLTPATRAAFEAARTEALWRHGELIGLTDGYRDAHAQARLFADAVRRTGSLTLARYWTLPPHESGHVAGIALDVRPAEGARWLERHGSRHHLYRVYDNEWWHFEYRPDGRPPRLPNPGSAIAAGSRANPGSSVLTTRPAGTPRCWRRAWSASSPRSGSTGEVTWRRSARPAAGRGGGPA